MWRRRRCDTRRQSCRPLSRRGRSRPRCPPDTTCARSSSRCGGRSGRRAIRPPSNRGHPTRGCLQQQSAESAIGHVRMRDHSLITSKIYSDIREDRHVHSFSAFERFEREHQGQFDGHRKRSREERRTFGGVFKSAAPTGLVKSDVFSVHRR